jgi:Hg(II)-responsive transcriptional regulator
LTDTACLVLGYRVDAGVVRTSELAERAGVNPQTLRYYERRGLLASPRRSTSGYREYPADALARLRFIKRARALGFSLDEAEELLHLAGGGPAACDAARELAAARLADIEARVADLARMRDSLAELVTRCDLPRADRACTLLQTLHEQTGEP